MHLGSEFEKYAVKHLGLNSNTLSGYEKYLVTGLTPNIIEERPMDGVRIAERPGFRMANIWATGEMPVRVDAEEAIDAVSGVHPPHNGTVLRIMDIPPAPQRPPLGY